MLGCLEAGSRIGRRYAKKDSPAAHEGAGTIEAAVFALLGLLLTLTVANGIAHLFRPVIFDVYDPLRWKVVDFTWIRRNLPFCFTPTS